MFPLVSVTNTFISDNILVFNILVHKILLHIGMSKEVCLNILMHIKYTIVYFSFVDFNLFLKLHYSINFFCSMNIR